MAAGPRQTALRRSPDDPPTGLSGRRGPKFTPDYKDGPGVSRAPKSFSSRLLLGCSRLKLCLADRLMASNGAANEDICAGVMTGACCRRNAFLHHVALEVATGKLKKCTVHATWDDKKS